MNKYRLWLLVIILIALALRLYNLTYHSLWFDEAVSVHWARQTVPRILEVGFTLVEDRLPPLYYLMLKGWTATFGFSESSVRSLSIVFGVLLAPVAASIAALLFNRRAALITAALVALNPFLIWYSQEARMYAPAVFFSALAVWAFLRMVLQGAGNRVASGKVASSKVADSRVAGGRVAGGRVASHIAFYAYTLLFILAAVASLYSHLYAGFLLPALGLWLVISYPRQWRIWFAFAVSGLVITLAFAPIALATWHFSAEATPGEPLTGLAQRAWWLLQAFTFWKAPLAPTFKIATPIAITLFVALAYLKPRPAKKNEQPAAMKNEQPLAACGKTPNYQYPIPRGRYKGSSLPITNHQLPITNQKFKTQNSKLKIKNPLLFFTFLLIFPFLIANVLLFRNHLAFFGERYFIVMVPWLLILTAVGADNLSQWINTLITRHPSPITHHSSRLLSASPFIILIALTALPIPGHWSTPAAKEAWRQSVDYLAQQATTADGILIHPDWVRFPFQYYFQGPGQTYAAFSTVSADTALDGPLQGVVGDHSVIWLIQSHLDGPDPNRLVEQWLATRYPLVTELHPPGITIKGYAPGYQLDTLPPEVTPVDFQFENGMRLVGYYADRVVSATDELFHPPSGWVHVTLYWAAGQPITGGATPFVHLVGPEGVWGASLERPNDALKFYPPSQWPVKYSIIRHDLDVNLNPVTPPGTYQLTVGLAGYETQYSLARIEIR